MAKNTGVLGIAAHAADIYGKRARSGRPLESEHAGTIFSPA